jgi:hypothetical protein
MTSLTPHLIRQATFGVICMPAPISLSSGAASGTVTFAPAFAVAMAAASPPIPAPHIPICVCCAIAAGCRQKAVLYIVKEMYVGEQDERKEINAEQET